MISRFLLAGALALLMVFSGIGSYVYLGTRQSNLTAPAQEPTSASPSPGAFNLPGTIFVTQSGAIYSLSAGRFHQLTSVAGWTQLAPYPGDNVLAVKRSLLFSDVYVVSRLGRVLRRLTNNTAPATNYDPSARHWSFYPRLSYNKKTLFMSYDKPKIGFDVPMSIWAVPLGKNVDSGKLWTVSIDYTGGDMQPLPLRSGALIYTKYLYYNSKIVSQIWITNQPETFYRCGSFCINVPPGPGHGRPLTTPEEDCAQPTLSPDGRTMAMICTHQTQVSYLALASWNGSSMGGRHNVITSQLVAQPTWAPDGSGIAYLAPAQLGQGFQLWFLPKLAYAPPPPSPVPTVIPTPGGPVSSPLPTPTPSPAAPPVVIKPVQMTTNLGFDATSAMVWIP
jgi:WD40 repeat protein